MRINAIKIQNFRAIKRLSIDNLDTTVLIAGPNGSGKSCVFDAIRLLKSIYGGYQQNETNQWFSEFQIRPEHLHADLPRLLQDKNAPLVIEAVFQLSDSENEFLKNDGPLIIEHSVWTTRVPQLNGYHYKSRPIDANLLRFKPEIDKEAKPIIDELLNLLKEKTYTLRIDAFPDGKIKFQPCIPMQVAFSIFDPEKIGVIDFHGANRNYSREAMHQNINLNVQSKTDQMAKHSLYNYGNKYTNIKQEMASEYVKEALAERAGIAPDDSSLTETLIELFNVFFPGKKFLGPVPTTDGLLDFPVQLEGGGQHDINDLSSGEKEVLYGYLRLRSSAPKDSIILLDEPELHLNPRLIRGLPKFYNKHLGKALNNQIWLVTHSDEFLRHSVNEPGFTVFHMQPPHALKEDEDQSKVVDAKSDLEGAVFDLVGDLALYIPNKAVVIFEGENSEFDVRMTLRLFPEFGDHVNTISAGNKSNVRKLHHLLEVASEKGELHTKFFSVTDRDFDDESNPSADKFFCWDVYHIENYLLHEEFLCSAISDLTLGKVELKPKELGRTLQICAEETIEALILHTVRGSVYKAVQDKLDFGFNPQEKDIGVQLFRSILRSKDKLDRLAQEELTEQYLVQTENQAREKFRESVSTGAWRTDFRGREILKRLIEKQGLGLPYETVRNVVLAKMADSGFQPDGMKKVILEIVNAANN